MTSSPGPPASWSLPLRASMLSLPSPALTVSRASDRIRRSSPVPASTVTAPMYPTPSRLMFSWSLPSLSTTTTSGVSPAQSIWDGSNMLGAQPAPAETPAVSVTEAPPSPALTTTWFTSPGPAETVSVFPLLDATDSLGAGGDKDRHCHRCEGRSTIAPCDSCVLPFGRRNRRSQGCLTSCVPPSNVTAVSKPVKSALAPDGEVDQVLLAPAETGLAHPGSVHGARVERVSPLRPAPREREAPACGALRPQPAPAVAFALGERRPCPEPAAPVGEPQAAAATTGSAEHGDLHAADPRQPADARRHLGGGGSQDLGDGRPLVGWIDERLGGARGAVGASAGRCSRASR